MSFRARALSVVALSHALAITAAVSLVRADTPPAGSAPNAQVSATAEALFEEGRALMKDKKYAPACLKLYESLRIDPAVGTMLYLADCYEKNGQTASAWSTFSDAVTAAQNAGQNDRALKAKQRVQALSSKLVKLTLTVAPETAGLDGLEIKRDGVVVGSAALGVAVPVDPGPHTLEAVAKGKKPWSSSVTIPSKAGAVISFVVPQLEDLPVLPPAPEPTATATAVVTAPPPKPTVTVTAPVTVVPPLPPPPTDTGAARTVGFVVGAIGIVGIGVASGLGGVASSKWNEAKIPCPNEGACPDATGVGLANDAKTLSIGSTVAFIVSGAMVATGSALVIYSAVARQKSQGAVVRQVVAGPGSITIRGQF